VVEITPVYLAFVQLLSKGIWFFETIDRFTVKKELGLLLFTVDVESR